MEEIGDFADENNPSALDLDADVLDEPAEPDETDKPAEPDETAEPDEPVLSSDDTGAKPSFDAIGPLERVPAERALAGPTLDLDALRRAEVERYPLLERDEECLLAQRWREHGDRAARDKLVNSHLRLVEKIARDIKRRCPKYIRLDDLIAEGRVGLVNAANGFDPSQGNRFSSYAKAAIRNAINGHIKGLASIVDVGDSLRRKFYALKKEVARLERVDNNALLRDEVALIAKRLGWKEEDVVKLHVRLFCRDVSLHTPISDKNGEGTDDKLQDQLRDEAPDPEERAANALALDDIREAARALLDPRSLRIFEARRLTGEPIPRPELAREFGVTPEYIRQIEVAAFKKLQKAQNSRSFKPARATRHSPLTVADAAKPAHGRLVDGVTLEGYQWLKDREGWSAWRDGRWLQDCSIALRSPSEGRDRQRAKELRQQVARGAALHVIDIAGVEHRVPITQTRVPRTAAWPGPPVKLKVRFRRVQLNPLAGHPDYLMIPVHCRRNISESNKRAGGFGNTRSGKWINIEQRDPLPNAITASLVARRQFKLIPKWPFKYDPIAEEEARAGVRSNLPMCRKSAKEYRDRQRRQRRTVAAPTAIEAPPDSLPIELRMLALGLPMPDSAQSFAMAAE
jgi:RNA polymerase sigma-32 factor